MKTWFLLGYWCSIVIISSGCSEKVQQTDAITIKKPAILKTQLEALDQAKQLEAKATADAVQQQETIERATQ